MLTLDLLNTPYNGPEQLNGKTGYFFGTFNPVHLGHLLFADFARQQLGLRRIVFVPAGAPPNKLFTGNHPDNLAQAKNTVTALASGQDRLTMTRLATANRACFEVYAGEVECAKTSSGTDPKPIYTINTLEAMLGGPIAQAKTKPVLLMGEDTLRTLPRWHRAQTLMQHCVFAATARLSPQNETLQPIAQPEFGATGQNLPKDVLNDLAIEWITMPRIEISASLIRRNIASGKSIHYLTPAPVYDFIQANRLYRGEAK
ncbi:MAG: nicotinate (nicotinamide) nucleotide adenylyltransferase [Vampirovibrionales bacterium]|nr:nicotinate (nicotinamide) nucleotide adenylyltransferase [Vampirovibrionales bacterium]